VDLAYNCFGQKSEKNILILHGLFGSKRNWFTIAKLIAQFGYRVWVVDLRNHGDTEWNESHSYFDLVEDIKEFIFKKEIKKISILGHSMGGKVAMSFDLFNQNVLEELIVVDIAPVAYSSNFTKYLEILDSIDLGKFSSRSQIDRKILGQIENSNLRSFLLQNLRVKKEETLSWRINIKAILRNSSNISNFPVFDNISRTKTLFLYGTKSEYSVWENKKTIERNFSNVFFQGIEGAGHWVHAEKPKEFIENVTNFLKTNYSR
jgi:pimeloyl-ACP methyl ester carboxylesterase